MFGGTRNGRVMKLAVVIGLFLLVLYFLISWRLEAQTLAQDLSTAEEEYEALMKRYNRLEKELKGIIVKETKLQESLREEQVNINNARKAMTESEAKYQTDIKSCKSQSLTLQGEKTELKEQIQAMKSDREAKIQEIQRLTEEMHESKQEADDEYQALSTTCVQNQQTCERRAKEAEEELVNVRAQVSTTYQSLQDCKNEFTAQQELADSCNAHMTALDQQAGQRLHEIEQLQSQLRLAQHQYESLVSKEHKQQEYQVGHHKVDQPIADVKEVAVHNIRKRYEDGNVPVEHINNEFHRAKLPSVNQGKESHHNDAGNRYQREAVFVDNDRKEEFRGADLGGRDQHFDLHGDRMPPASFKKNGEVKESFDDIRISDEQKKNVFDSLQGKLSRGEILDDRQLDIYHILSKEFEHSKEHAGNDVPIRNGMGMEHHQHEQQKQPVDDNDNERLDSKQQQLPDPLDEGEVKDLVEEHQKPDEFDNLGRERKVDVVDREQEEAAGAGGEELKQPKDGDQEGLDEEDEHYLHEDGNPVENRDDNPLPKPGQDENMPDDEDDYGAKKEKHGVVEENQVNDMYGDQAYRRDQELFKQERLQDKKFDRQL